MYQHDLAETQLKNTMDEVISECVSYVGVDLNTASHSLLKYNKMRSITYLNNL